SSSYPEDILHDVADEVLRLFEEARKAQLPVNEFRIHFASLHITARDARGGAIIFLSPAIPIYCPLTLIAYYEHSQKIRPVDRPDGKLSGMLEAVQPLHQPRARQEIQPRG